MAKFRTHSFCDIPRISVPREGEFPRNNVPRGAILRRDGFAGTPVLRRINARLPGIITTFLFSSSQLSTW